MKIREYLISFAIAGYFIWCFIDEVMIGGR